MTTIVRDKILESFYRIDSLRYISSTQVYKVFTFGECITLVNYFIPEDSMKLETIPFVHLSQEFNSYAYIDTMTLSIQTHFIDPADGIPGGYKSWGFYEKQ